MVQAVRSGSKPGFNPSLALDDIPARNPDKKRGIGKGKNPNSLANLKPFQPGNNMNPGGRPKGAKTRLEADFMWALADSFAIHGKGAIEAVIADKPHEYLKICASLMPKQLEVTTTMLDEMTLEQLEESLATLRRMSNEEALDVESKPAADPT